VTGEFSSRGKMNLIKACIMAAIVFILCSTVNGKMSDCDKLRNIEETLKSLEVRIMITKNEYGKTIIRNSRYGHSTERNWEQLDIVHSLRLLELEKERWLSEKEIYKEKCNKN
jgi:hypothetical protein